VSRRPSEAAIKAANARCEIRDQLEWSRIAGLVGQRLEELVADRARVSVSAPAVVRVCWEGPQLVNHSLALVNREMELALLQTNRLDPTIRAIGGEPFAKSLDRRARVLRKL